MKTAIALLLLASAGICCGQTKAQPGCCHADGGYDMSGNPIDLHPQVEALPQYRCERNDKGHEDPNHPPLWMLMAGNMARGGFDTKLDCEQSMNLIAKEEPDLPKQPAYPWCALQNGAKISGGTVSCRDGDLYIEDAHISGMDVGTEPMTGLHPKHNPDADYCEASIPQPCSITQEQIRTGVIPGMVPGGDPSVKPHCTDHISYFGVHLWTGPDGNIKGATEQDCEEQLKADSQKKRNRE